MNRLSKYIAIAFLPVAIVACDDDENTGDSTLTPTSPVATITIGNPDINFEEKDSTFTFTITLDKPQIVDVAFDIAASGDGDNDDFTYSSTVFVPANRTSARFNFKVNADVAPEGEEVTTFTITGGPNVTLTNPVTFKVTNQNYISPDLDIDVEWAAEFNGEDPEEIVDYDVLLFNSNEDLVAYSAGATFESFTMSGELPDGEYTLVANLFATADFGDFGPIALPLTTTFNRDGAFLDVVYEQPSGEIATSDDVDSNIVIAVITKEDGIYTIKSADGLVTVANGRVRAPK